MCIRDRSWGETLLTPTKIYVKPALAACKACDVHGIAHITGGEMCIRDSICTT